MHGRSRLSFALLLLFVLSGFAGLVYQSVWTHYLGLTLGHAAYAQTLVLAIFMGGMAIGAWLASHYSLRWRRLILGYAVIEAVIGVAGLLFHPAFVAYTGISQQSILPSLESVALAQAYQWLSATALIAPQSVLLGATFPLMSAGLIRALPGAQGEVLGGLYFTNSLGAALGALATTFLLLPLIGMPGAVLTAGALNILVALVAWLISHRIEDQPVSVAVVSPAGVSGDPQELSRLGRVLLWATAVSGAASFVYEIGWVRLLNQAFGTTVHSFELMLTAFILGLAFGGLWVRRHAQRIRNALRYVGYVQVWMAVAALVSIPVFTQSFFWVEAILSVLSRTDGGYFAYEVATAAVALLVMFPAAFLAGMTLPLFTMALLRAGADERAIGRVYAANTLGAIVGVAVMVHVLVPTIGVVLAVTLGALVDGLVGVYLLRARDPGRTTRMVAAAVVSLFAALGVALLLGQPDPAAQTSGVFRTGVGTYADTRVHYLKDGKTATVSVLDRGDGMLMISTNGKPDASLTPSSVAPSSDEVTMSMLGVLPLVLHPDPAEVAIIGFGSGLSTHTLLGSDVPKRVDTIEIERAMVEGARLYGPRVSRAYEDPRSSIRIEDARTYFSTGNRQYDVIVSEPSNPWVSGVSSLFTHEFYAFLRGHLKSDGMLIQWLHLYEIDDRLVGTMLAALAQEFPQADLFLANEADLIIVARESAGPLRLSSTYPRSEALVEELRRVGIDRPEQLRLRHLGSVEILHAYLRMTSAVPHSDYYPVVALNAPRTRFRGASADVLPAITLSGFPVMDVIDCRVPVSLGVKLPPDADLPAVGARQFAIDVSLALQASELSSPSMLAHGHEAVARLHALSAMSQSVRPEDFAIGAWGDEVATLAATTIGHLSASDLRIWSAPEWVSPMVREVPDARALLDAYAALARRDARGMREGAAALLELQAGERAPFSSTVTEQMLVIAMLGAAGEGDHAGIRAAERSWGQHAGGSPRWLPVRSFLLAWAAGRTPACQASGGRNTSSIEWGVPPAI